MSFTGTLGWTGGTMSGIGKTFIDAGGTLNISGNSTKTLSRTLQNDGAANWIDSGQISFAGGTLDNNGTFTANPGSGLNAFGISGVNSFINDGTFIKQGVNTVSFLSSPAGMPFSNAGIVNVNAGTLNLSSTITQYNSGTNTLTGGTWNVAASSTLNFPAGASIRTNAGNISLTGSASNFPALAGFTTNTGTFTLAGGRDFAATPVGGTFSNNGGTINLGPGSTLSVTGAFTQPGSTLHMDIAGPVAGTNYGQVTATGAITLDGELTASIIGGYDPAYPISFPVVTGASRLGIFSSFSGGITPSSLSLKDTYNATSALVSLATPVPSSPDLVTESDSGVSGSDNITNDNTPTFTGTAADGATVRIYADGNEVGSGLVSGGTYLVTTSALGDGSQVITARTDFGGSELSDPSADAGTSTADLRFPGFASGILPDGNYQATLFAAGVTDTAGNPLVAGSTLDFFFLQADANRDRKVDTQDFNLLAGNFRGSGKVFSEGDFNYDAAVDSVDFNILVTQYGRSLPAPASPAASVAASAQQRSAVFGSSSIEGENDVENLIA